MEEIQDLIKQIDFNNLTCYYKGKNVPKTFIGFKGTLSFYRSIKEGYITLKQAEKQHKKLKSNINEVILGSKRIRRSKKYNKKY